MNELSTNSLKTTQKPRKCPKCDKKYYGYPALSREDNKTEICPKCGAKEALSKYLEISRA